MTHKESVTVELPDERKKARVEFLSIFILPFTFFFFSLCLVCLLFVPFALVSWVPPGSSLGLF